MNIGIITFHWGANHGAVLQAYALSEYLRNQYGANTEIIDYYPKKFEITAKNTYRLRNLKVIKRKICELKKENNIKPFRKHLTLSKRYYSNHELITDELQYDVLITGSDQVWNPSFLRGGEGGVTPVYFLNFGKPQAKKISVSASFGCSHYPQDCQEIVRPFLKCFHEISVRENTGLKIVENMGLSATVTADPTALLTSEQYLYLCNSAKKNCNTVSKMILRHQSKNVNALINAICKSFSSDKIMNICDYSIPDWLTAIRDSKIVITNSFHCVMMCLKLHTPFAVVLEDGKKSGMNDRFQTLLDMFGLSERIVNSEEDLSHIANPIDFCAVDSVMEYYSESLRAFLDRNIC
jgi:hypothetical protein